MIVAVVVVTLVVVVSRALLDRAGVMLPGRCVVSAAGKTAGQADGPDAVQLDPEQAQNAALIGAVALRRRLPARAALIATATAMQESKLRNLDHGDRDSLGLFQQRPSQGWGTPAQVMNPQHATEAFYDRLVKVRGYLDRPLTVVAQEVQRSGFPDAYADHEPDAKIVAAAFTGAVPRAVTCQFTPDAAANANTPSRLAGDLSDVLGLNPTSTRRELTVSTDSDAGTAAVGAWIVAHSPDAHVQTVSTRGWTWTAGRHADWTRAGGGTARSTTVTFRR